MQKKSVHCLQCHSHSAGLYYVQRHKLECSVQKWDYYGQGQVHSEG